MHNTHRGVIKLKFKLNGQGELYFTSYLNFGKFLEPLGSMPTTESYHQTCSCQRTFRHPAALKNHQNSCVVNKERLALALASAKGILEERKLKRKERIFNNLNPEQKQNTRSEEVDHEYGYQVSFAVLVSMKPLVLVYYSTLDRPGGSSFFRAPRKTSQTAEICLKSLYRFHDA